MSKFHFTSRSIEALKPKEIRTDYYDASFKVRGINFGIRVYTSGAKEYFVRYRGATSVQHRMSLGDGKVLSLSAAHVKAKKIAAQLANGENPAEDLKKYKKSETVEQLCNEYLEKHASKKRDGGYEDRRMLNKDVIPAFGKWKACDLKRKHIIALLDEVAISRGAEVSSRRLRSLLSKLFNFALEREIVELSPTAGLPRQAKAQSRERVLSVTEIEELWSFLDSEPLVNRSLYRLILITGQRPMEVARMEWGEIKGTFWEIPGEKTKNERTHKVPLSSLALSIIEELIPLRKGSYVFNGERAEHVKIRTLQHVTERINEKIKGDRFTAHDLRRTAATHIRRLGVSQDVVSRILNHTIQGVTAIYDRYDQMPEATTALENWALELARIAKVTIPKTKIFAIGKS